MFRRFQQSKSGNFAMIAAIAAPVLFAGAGGMMDYSIYRNISGNLQQAADSAALAAANQSIVQGWNYDVAYAVARDYVETNLASAGVTNGSYSMQVDVDELERKVKVSVKQDEFGYLIMGYLKSTPYITASATAQAVSDANICIIGLMEPQRFAKSSIHLDNNARIDSPECGLYAESDHRYGFRVDRNATVTANVICSAGGFMFSRRSDGADQVFPQPTTDCPKIGDPMASRTPLSVGACDFTNRVVTSREPVPPGVYCGGLKIDGDFRIDLDAGVYIIKDGPLEVTGRAAVVGRNTGFYMVGAGSTFSFGADTSIELEAPRTGPLAGILFFEDKNVPHSFNFNPFALSRLPSAVRLNRIASNNARTLVGTFYMPKSIILINANAPVADRSAYTAIVTGRLWLQEGPTLVLNADYAATTVPVPDGIGPQDKGVKLVE